MWAEQYGEGKVEVVIGQVKEEEVCGCWCFLLLAFKLSSIVYMAHCSALYLWCRRITPSPVAALHDTSAAAHYFLTPSTSILSKPSESQSSNL